MFSLHCTRRRTHTTLDTLGVDECICDAWSSRHFRVVCVLLSMLQAHEVDKSEDFSRRKRSSHMHETHNNKEITCNNIISGVAMCICFVLRMLFEKSILVKCLREISITKKHKISGTRHALGTRESVLRSQSYALLLCIAFWSKSVHEIWTLGYTTFVHGCSVSKSQNAWTANGYTSVTCFVPQCRVHRGLIRRSSGVRKDKRRKEASEQKQSGKRKRKASRPREILHDKDDSTAMRMK